MFGIELLSNIYGIIVAILILSILVAVHEAGHLLMAKWSNVRVDVFSIGMGKAICGFQKGETYYQIGRLPFGGFCGFGDEENPNDTDPRALQNSPLWARLLTVIGGSLFNLIFAYLVMVIMYSAGFQEEQLTNTVAVPAQVVNPSDNTKVPSPAYTAGLRSGDTIINISGKPITHFQEMTIALAFADADNTPKEITYVRGESTNTTSVNAINDFKTGISIIGVYPVSSAIINDVLADGVAEEAGLQDGDKFISINNQAVEYFHQVVETITNGQPLSATIVSGNTTNTKTITPRLVDGRYIIGIKAELPIFIKTKMQAKSFADAFVFPFSYISNIVSQIQMSLVKLFTGQVDAQQNLSGPVRIISITGDIAKTFNFSLLIKFMIMLSVALAVFNLLPFPGLDGGHIILQTARSIFKDKPFAEKIIGAIEHVGVILLLTMAVFVLFNDIKNLFFNPEDRAIEEVVETVDNTQTNE